MFFKKLELNGFKSFATKTTVDFQPGVTVIVGPNGCGKSNVFDSVRWVLGEQNARHLRGGRMTDVIFSGSSSFKAQGMAQVSLTIDNEDRSLPIDFSEVNITRKLFADGQSEYLLNKTPCRLRDITDLFLDTGLGAQGYSVMEQGKVDTIINAKPLERRALFEEAAGIHKYKIRRGEALRKLERTEADFTRLKDLLGEVGRQAGSLKRQASKAERYKMFSDEARAVERQLIVARHEEHKTKLTEATREHAGLEDRLMALGARIADLEAALERGHSEDNELGRKLSDLRSRHHESIREIERAEHAISMLRERMTDGERRRGQMGDERGADAREEFDLAAQLGRARAELRELDAKLSSDEAYYTESKAEFDEMRGGREGVLGRLDSARTEREKVMSEKAVADNAARTAEALIQRLDEQINGGDLKYEELRVSVDALQGRLEVFDQRFQEAETKRAESKTEIESLNGLIAGATREVEALETQLSQTEGRRGKAHSKLSALEDLEASYEGYYQGVRNAMQAGADGRLRGLRGVVAQLIQSSAEHEIAIEAALGSHVQDIVAQKADDARAAIEYLKAGRGRATFLPLDLLEVHRPNNSFENALHKPGVIGAASSLVHYDSEIEIAVKFLLGSTLVVDSLETAITLERQGLRNRYVSLDGQIVSPQGSISGGQVRASGLMSREREIRELRDLVVTLDKEIGEGRLAVQTLRQGLRENRDRSQALVNQLQSIEIERAGLIKDRESSQGALGERRQSMDEFKSRREKWLDEIHAHREVIGENAERSASMAGALASCDERIKAAQSEMAIQDMQVDSLAGSLSELRSEIATTRERIDRLRSRLDRMAKRQLQICNINGRRSAEIREIDFRRVESDEAVEEKRGELGVVFEARRTLELAIATEEQDKEEIARAMRDRTQALHSLRSDRNGMHNETQESALRKNEAEVRLLQVAEQAQVDFQTSLEDLLAAVRAELAEAGMGLDTQDELFARFLDLKRKMESMGLVNLSALEEYEEQAKRLEFLTAQETDLATARDQLQETIQEIDRQTKTMFYDAFEIIRGHFIDMFRRMFGGGRADLILSAPEEGQDPILEGGIEIVAQPPGKKLQSISLMSGGEKALTATALLFAVFLHRPSPFCILDEIDAPLDDNNVERFKKVLLEFSKETQFIIITHNKQTMTLADSIYGVTMEEAGVSKLVSVRFDESVSLAG